MDPHQTLDLLVSPAIFSTKLLMNGRFSIILNPGILRRNSTTKGKKPRNSWKNPYNSNIIPTIGHPRRTTKIPPKKNRLALILLDWKKNLHVLSSPTMKAIPARKRIFPIANKPLSKSKTTPRKRKKPPNPTRPMPIFWVSVGWNMIKTKVKVAYGVTNWTTQLGSMELKLGKNNWNAPSSSEALQLHHLFRSKS